MSTCDARPPIALPKNWKDRVKSAVLQVIALAQYATAYTRVWAANSPIERIRLKADNTRLRQEVALLREELGIKDARMGRIDPRRRPHYSPTERMRILELRAARGWNAVRTAATFLVTEETISSWTKRVDEQGPDALLRLPQPVNKFPDFVQHAVCRLKTLCPGMGKVKIAQTLARAGLHLGATTVGRMLTRPPAARPAPQSQPAAERPQRVVTAKHPNHVWHADLTTVPIGGFWCPWPPLALPQCWPFCWWLILVVDQFSRRIMGVAVFPGQPTQRDVRAFLEPTFADQGIQPKYLITDQGPQFHPKTHR